MRLDKFLSHATGYSRKEVKRLLHAGEVTVNSEPERNSARQVEDTDQVELNGLPIDPPRTRYLMLHKPEGYVCSHDERDHPSVLNLIELPRADELIIAGRLDLDTTGLLLLSDDGGWCHRVTSPKHKLGKTYEVECADPIPESATERFQRGLMLHDEKQRTQPAHLELLGAHSARVTLYEGRYHQVKRMFAALGNRVTALHRSSIGPLELDDALFEGEYRDLTDEEVTSLIHG